MKEPLRQRKKTRTRRAIVEAGTALFQKKGFDAATLEEIADSADVHKQTVLRYFKSKEEIAFALRDKIFENFVDHLAERPGSVLGYWRTYIEQTSKATYQSGELKAWFDFIDSDTRLFAYQLRLNERYQATLSQAFSEEAGVDPQTDVFSQCLAAILVTGNSNVARMTIRNGDVDSLQRNLLAVVDLAATLHREEASTEAAPAPKKALKAKA